MRMSKFMRVCTFAYKCGRYMFVYCSTARYPLSHVLHYENHL